MRAFLRHLKSLTGRQFIIISILLFAVCTTGIVVYARPVIHGLKMTQRFSLVSHLGHKRWSPSPTHVPLIEASPTAISLPMNRPPLELSPTSMSSPAPEVEENSQVGPSQNSTSTSTVGTSPAPANSQTRQMYVTSYGYNDNDDGSNHFGTTAIAYPKSDGYPTLHNTATEGTGTYADPITFAAGVRDIEAGVFPIGSIIYAPYLQKYFILEDQCASCGDDLQGAEYHIDFWMGPSSASDKTALENCQSKITQKTGIILKPSVTLPVDTTPLFQNNQCTAHIY